MIFNYLVMDTSDLLGAAGLLQNSLTNAANFSFAGDNKSDAEDLMIKQHNLAMEAQWDAQSWQKYMWDLTNEYNLPANSIARLKDAGLNTALMYGSGDTAGQASGASSSPTASPGGTPSVQRIPMQAVSPGLLTAASDIRLRDSDAKLSLEKSNTERSQQSLNDFTSILHNALAGKAGSEADLARVNTSLGEIQNLFLRDTFDDRKAITHEQLKQVCKSIFLLDEQVHALKASNSVAYEQARWTLDSLKADTAVSIAQAEYQRKYNKEMLPEQVQLLRSTITLNSQTYNLRWPSERRAENFRLGMTFNTGDAQKVSNRWWINDVESSGFERFDRYVGAVSSITGISSDIIGSALDVYTVGASRGLRNPSPRSFTTERFDKFGEIIGGSVTRYH